MMGHFHEVYVLNELQALLLLELVKDSVPTGVRPRTVLDVTTEQDLTSFPFDDQSQLSGGRGTSLGIP